MNEMKIKLISQARTTFNKIYPCGKKTEIGECFTEIGNRLLFWFNTEDQSTHLMVLPFDETK